MLALVQGAERPLLSQTNTHGPCESGVPLRSAKGFLQDLRVSAQQRAEEAGAAGTGLREAGERAASDRSGLSSWRL